MSLLDCPNVSIIAVFDGKGTKKSVNRTYTIYGFIYPFYGIYLPLANSSISLMALFSERISR